MGMVGIGKYDCILNFMIMGRQVLFGGLTYSKNEYTCYSTTFLVCDLLLKSKIEWALQLSIL